MKLSRVAVSPAVAAVAVIIAAIVAGGGAYYVGRSTAPSSTVTSTETISSNVTFTQTVSGGTHTATTTVMGTTETATATQTVVGGTETVSTTVTGPTETATTTQTATYISTTTSTRTVTNPALLPAPVQTSPENGTTFSNYPRTTELQWDPVSGAAYYLVQVDYYSPGDTTCTGGTLWDMNVTASTMYTFSFVGAQPGCWTVSAVAPDGQAGLASQWLEFAYTV